MSEELAQEVGVLKTLRCSGAEVRKHAVRLRRVSVVFT